MSSNARFITARLHPERPTTCATLSRERVAEGHPGCKYSKKTESRNNSSERTWVIQAVEHGCVTNSTSK